jgi:hypothetical protein
MVPYGLEELCEDNQLSFCSFADRDNWICDVFKFIVAACFGGFLDVHSRPQGLTCMQLHILVYGQGISVTRAEVFEKSNEPYNHL